MKGRTDIISGVVLLVFVAWGFSLAAKLPGAAANASFGPGFFPKLILSAMALCSIILLVSGFRRLRAEKGASRFNYKNALRLAAFVALMIAYIAAFTKVGFLVSSIVFVVVGELMFNIRKPLWIAVSSLSISFILYYAFTNFFKVPLP